MGNCYGELDLGKSWWGNEKKKNYPTCLAFACEVLTQVTTSLYSATAYFFEYLPKRGT